MSGRWDAKVNLEITGSARGFVGRDYGIKERYWEPSNFIWWIIDNSVDQNLGKSQAAQAHVTWKD